MPNHDELERISPENAGIESSQVRRCLEKLTNEWASMHGFMAARDGKVFAECFWAPYSKDLVHGNNSLGKTYTGTAVGTQAVVRRKNDRYLCRRNKREKY